MTTRLKKLVQAVPRTREELETMVKATVEMQTEREGLIARRDAARLEADKPFTPRLGELDTAMARNLELLEAWAETSRAEFGRDKSIVVAGHRLGWKLGNWKTSLLKKVKWADVLAGLRDWTLATAGKLQRAAADRWLRIKEEPDKEAMIADRADAERAPLLAELGVEIVQEETFYLAPDREGQQPPLMTADAR